MVRMFAEAENTDVTFADVSLRDASHDIIRGHPYSVGVGGWPTIHYFNRDVVGVVDGDGTGDLVPVGVGVGKYQKKTSLSISVELGPKYDYMLQYIEDVGNTILCNVVTLVGCSQQELQFVQKWNSTTKTNQQQQKELSRLSKLIVQTNSDNNDNVQQQHHHHHMNNNVNVQTPEFQRWVTKRIKLLNKILSMSSTDDSTTVQEVKDEL